MSGFSPVATVTGISEEEYKKLVAEWGHRVSLKAMWSWNGELVDVEDFDEINKISDDPDGAGYDKLMASNNRG